jgi:hypothetical protein
MTDCTHPAEGYVVLAILGIVPSCYSCAQVMGNVIGEQCSTCFKWIPFGAAHYVYPCGDGTPSADAECDECTQDHILSCLACLASIRDAEDRS